MEGKGAHELRQKESALILRFEDIRIAGKLMAMGIMPQARIEMVRRNALGQTLVFRINNRFKIALRKDEAQTILVAGL